jgi:peptidoglycan/LPS O-acetylase OafA/YrhL
MFSWIGWKGLIANFALMQNVANYPSILGVLWSLPLEVQMYIVLPFAYFSIRRDRDYGSFTLVLITVVMGVGVLLLGPSHPSLMYRLWVFIYAPCFTAGIVAFNLIQSENGSGDYQVGRGRLAFSWQFSGTAPSAQ